MSEDVPNAPPTGPAMEWDAQRRRLAELLGRILARHWLLSRGEKHILRDGGRSADDSVPPGIDITHGPA
jgi:hypothetical protein